MLNWESTTSKSWHLMFNGLALPGTDFNRGTINSFRAWICLDAKAPNFIANQILDLIVHAGYISPVSLNDLVVFLIDDSDSIGAF